MVHLFVNYCVHNTVVGTKLQLPWLISPGKLEDGAIHTMKSQQCDASMGEMLQLCTGLSPLYSLNVFLACYFLCFILILSWNKSFRVAIIVIIVLMYSRLIILQ